jgi:hypothetical protein
LLLTSTAAAQGGLLPEILMMPSHFDCESLLVPKFYSPVKTEAPRYAYRGFVFNRASQNCW